MNRILSKDGTRIAAQHLKNFQHSHLCYLQICINGHQLWSHLIYIINECMCQKSAIMCVKLFFFTIMCGYCDMDDYWYHVIQFSSVNANHQLTFKVANFCKNCNCNLLIVQLHFMSGPGKYSKNITVVNLIELQSSVVCKVNPQISPMAFTTRNV